MLHRKGINDNITLAPLIAFYSVNANPFECFDAEFLYLFTNHGYLIAIRNDYTDGLVCIK